MPTGGGDLAVFDRPGADPALVWGHGLLSSMAHEDVTGPIRWPEVELGGRRLVRHDARGHGDSARATSPSTHTWPARAADVLGVLDSLAIGRAVLGGASMGCASALHAAVTAPERVAGLVLVIPPTAWGTRPRQARLYRGAAHVVSALGTGPLDLLARLAPTPPAYAQPEQPPVRARGDRRVVTAILRGSATSDLPAEDRLAALDIPAEVLAWTGDPTHPVSTAERLAELLDAPLHVASAPAEVDAWPALVTRFLLERAPA